MPWEQKLKKNICTIDQLKKYGNIPPQEEKQLKKIIERHPMSITPYYASLIDWTNPDDPLWKMAVPSLEELNLAGSYDTSGEAENTKLIGLQHKYSPTALILSTTKCALYCRYCFRKRLVGRDSSEISKRFDEAVSYIQEHKEINNVLISGGDPFSLSTPMIERLLRRITPIHHVQFIRFGTKVPVVFPERISEDKELLDILKSYSLDTRRIYVVTQFNHPREITPQAIRGIDKLIRRGIIVSNQSVLLKGVNNKPEILAELLQKLVQVGVNPYYVFQCRPVKRVKHGFQDSLYRGYHIIEEAKRMMNGHAKRFKYVMSHKSGKIEIVGVTKKEIYFKFHQSKDPRHQGKLFKRRLNKKAGWLDELSENYFLSDMFGSFKGILS